MKIKQFFGVVFHRAAAVSILLFVFCMPPVSISEPLDTDEPGIVARVGEHPITMEDFNRNLGVLKQRYAEMGFKPEGDQLDELKKNVVNNLVEKELLYRESRSKDISVDDDIVEEELDQIRNSFEDAGAFNDALKQMGYSIDFLKKEIRTNMAIQALLDQELASKTEVSEEEIRAFYESRPDNFTTPEQLRARHILIGPDSGGLDTIREIRSSVAEGGDFEQLAKEHSECPSGQNGGDLGYFGRGQMVDAFEKAAFALEIDEVSDVVETRFGYHIIKLEERRPEEVKSFDTVRADIETQLRRQKVSGQMQPYMESLQEKYPVEILLPEMQP